MCSRLGESDGWCTPLRKPVCPERISARLGTQSGFAQVARVKTVPSRVKRSRFGVCIRSFPSAPIVSGRWSSESKNTMFGYSAANAELLKHNKQATKKECMKTAVREMNDIVG